MRQHPPNPESHPPNPESHHPEPESNPNPDQEPSSSPDPLNDPTITFTAADFITAPGSAVPARARILPPPLTAARNRTVARAGDSAIRTARAAALVRTQRSARFGSIGRHSSPRKQTFELEVGNNQSPQRLFVTVESSRDYGRPRGLEMGSSRRRLFPDPPASTTSRVPLKDEEAAATPRRRGRPAKAKSTPKSRTPATRLAGRAATPGPAAPAAPAATAHRRSSLRLMQRVDDADRNHLSVHEGGYDHHSDDGPLAGRLDRGRHGGNNRDGVRNRQGEAGPDPEAAAGLQEHNGRDGHHAAGRGRVPSGRDRLEGDGGGGTEHQQDQPPSAKPGPESRSRKRKGGSPAKGGTAKKRKGRPAKARAPAVPEEARDGDAADADDAAPAQATSPGRVAGSYLPPGPGPESEPDIWMAAASDDRAEPVPATAGLRPRVLSSSSLSSLSSASELSGNHDFDSGPDVAMSGAADGDNDDSDNEPAEHLAASGANSRRDLDTIAQGEEFSMIFMDSIRSNRPAVAPTAPEDLGEETSLIINNTLQSLRASRTEPPPEPGREPESPTGGPEQEAGRQQQLMPPPWQPSSRISQTAANATNGQTGSPLQWTPRKARSVARQIQAARPSSGGQPSSKPLTPSDTPSPRATLPPLLSVQSTSRPTLSPIVRAGRVLQSVTSDPPTPGVPPQGVLGSPFRLAPGERDPQADKLAAAAAIVARLRSRVPPPPVSPPPARPAPRKTARPFLQRPLPDEQGHENSGEDQEEDADPGQDEDADPGQDEDADPGQDEDADPGDDDGADDDLWAVEASRPTPRANRHVGDQPQGTVEPSRPTPRTNQSVGNQQQAPKQTPALARTSTLAGFFSSPAVLPGMLLSGGRDTLGLGAESVNTMAYESETGPAQMDNTMFPSAGSRATNGQAPPPAVLQRVQANKNSSMMPPAAPAAPPTRPAAAPVSITQQHQSLDAVPARVLPPMGFFPTPVRAPITAQRPSPAAAAAPARPSAGLPPVGLFQTPAEAKIRIAAQRRPAPAASTVSPGAVLPTIRQKRNFDPRPGQSSSRGHSFARPSTASNPAGPPSDEQLRLVTPPQMQLSRNDIRQWQEQTSGQQAIEVDEIEIEVDENETEVEEDATEVEEDATEVEESENEVDQEAESENPTEAVAQSQPEPVRDHGDKNKVTCAPPSETKWARDDWIFLDKLIRMRRLGPLPAKIAGPPRPPHRLLGRIVQTDGSRNKIEQWHMDVVGAFKHRMSETWTTEDLVKRINALVVADMRREDAATGRTQA